MDVPIPRSDQDAQDDFDEPLLGSVAWVERFARDLLRDPALAEDVTQDVLTAALEHRGDLLRTTSLRAWLRRITHNLALRRASRESHRSHVESEAARSEAVVHSEERLELHRHLVEAVADLDEIHRVVVVLRFFEGLSHREIAERLGVPEATVRKRVTRALPALRSSLRCRVDLDADDWRETFGRGAAGLARSRPQGPVVAFACVVALAALAVGWVVRARSIDATIVRVLCPAGVPVEQARVEWFDAAGAPSSGQTDERGQLVLPAGVDRVLVVARNRLPIVRSVEPRAATTIRVGVGASLEGRLVIDGEPAAAGLALRWRLAASELDLGPFAQRVAPRLAVETTTIDGGLFRFEGLPPGSIGQLALPDDLRVAFVLPGAPLADRSGARLTVAPSPILLAANARSETARTSDR